jgi:hypothetical protein
VVNFSAYSIIFKEVYQQAFCFTYKYTTSAEILARKKRISLFYQRINNQENFIKLLTLPQMLQQNRLEFLTLKSFFSQA